MKRSKLHEADYNPRTIDRYGQENLARSVKNTEGLIQPIIFNKRTGNIVGGHQRIAVMDQLEGYPDRISDYDVPVVVVDYDEKKEIEVNISLNNPNAQGMYDLEMLGELFETVDVDLLNTGFDLTSLETMFHGNGFDLPERFLPETDITELSDIMGDVTEIMEESNFDKEDEKRKEEIDKIKQAKKEFSERAEFHGQVRFYKILTFPTDSACRQFMELLGHDPEAEMIDGMVLSEQLGFDISVENDLAVMEQIEGDDNEDDTEGF